MKFMRRYGRSPPCCWPLQPSSSSPSTTRAPAAVVASGTFVAGVAMATVAVTMVMSAMPCRAYENDANEYEEGRPKVVGELPSTI